jgi:hypothetical protein
LFAALVSVFLLAVFGFSLADNNFPQPTKKSIQIHPHVKTQVVRNDPKPAHHAIGYTKKKNDSFSHLNN